MAVKFRVWTGKETLASINGRDISSAEGLIEWLKKQPDGQIEHWAGRWWVCSKEAVPFLLRHGKAHCAHPSYRSKIGLDTQDFPDFFAYEVWKRAKRSSDFWFGIDGIFEGLLK